MEARVERQLSRDNAPNPLSLSLPLFLDHETTETTFSDEISTPSDLSFFSSLFNGNVVVAMVATTTSTVSPPRDCADQGNGNR